MDTQQLIRQRLSPLAIERLDIIDDSAKHRGHVGAAAGGGHYHLKIASLYLSGLSRLTAHRHIYQLLGDLFPAPIHALQIDISSH